MITLENGTHCDACMDDKNGKNTKINLTINGITGCSVSLCKNCLTELHKRIEIEMLRDLIVDTVKNNFRGE